MKTKSRRPLRVSWVPGTVLHGGFGHGRRSPDSELPVWLTVKDVKWTILGAFRSPVAQRHSNNDIRTSGWDPDTSIFLKLPVD